MSGLFTSMGVESTGRAGYDHGYNVTYAADAMADPDQITHAHSTQRVFPRIGEVGTVADVLAALARLGR